MTRGSGIIAHISYSEFSMRSCLLLASADTPNLGDWGPRLSGEVMWLRDGNSVGVKTVSMAYLLGSPRALTQRLQLKVTITISTSRIVSSAVTEVTEGPGLPLSEARLLCAESTAKTGLASSLLCYL